MKGGKKNVDVAQKKAGKKEGQQRPATAARNNNSTTMMEGHERAVIPYNNNNTNFNYSVETTTVTQRTVVEQQQQEQEHREMWLYQQGLMPQQQPIYGYPIPIDPSSWEAQQQQREYREQHEAAINYHRYVRFPCILAVCTHFHGISCLASSRLSVLARGGKFSALRRGMVTWLRVVSHSRANCETL